MSQHIFTGTAPPSTTPANVGDHFIDTTNDVAYISVGTASSADWQTGTGLSGNVRISGGYLEIQNEDTSSWHQITCWNNLDGVPELRISDTGV